MFGGFSVVPKKKRRNQPKRSKMWNCLQLLVGDRYECIECFKTFDMGKISVSNVRTHVMNNHPQLYAKYHDDNDKYPDSVTNENFNLKIAEWVLRRNHPFSIVEEPELIQLLKKTPLSRNSLVKLVPEISRNYFLEVKFLFNIINKY